MEQYSQIQRLSSFFGVWALSAGFVIISFPSLLIGYMSNFELVTDVL